MKSIFYESPIGKLTILTSGDEINRVVFGYLASNDILNDDSKLKFKIVNQLNEYFANRKKQFSLKLHPEGTEFQTEVWNRLLEIPYGETITYSDLAAKIGRPKAIRAVGNACRKNPVPILIPCHRVIGKNGTLTGYAGGIENKKLLLDLEKKSK